MVVMVAVVRSHSPLLLCCSFLRIRLIRCRIVPAHPSLVSPARPPTPPPPLAAAGGSDRRGGKGSKRRRASDDELPPGELPSAGIARTMGKLHCWLAAALLFYYASPVCRREVLGAAGGADCVVAEVAKVFQQLAATPDRGTIKIEALKKVLHEC